ncbi:MAG: hypothetical protein V4612_01510 [Pseudomonadota bacterium]
MKKLKYQFVTFLTGSNPEYLPYLFGITKMGRGDDERGYKIKRSLVVDDAALKMIEEEIVEVPYSGMMRPLNFVYNSRQISFRTYLEENGIEILNAKELFKIYRNKAHNHFRSIGISELEAQTRSNGMHERVEKTFSLLGGGTLPESTKTDFLKAMSLFCGTSQDADDQTAVLAFDLDIYHTGKVDFPYLDTVYELTDCIFADKISFTQETVADFARRHPSEEIDLIMEKYELGKGLQCISDPKTAIELYHTNRDDATAGRTSEFSGNRVSTYPFTRDILEYHIKTISEAYYSARDTDLDIKEYGRDEVDLKRRVDELVNILYVGGQTRQSIHLLNQALKIFQHNNPQIKLTNEDLNNRNYPEEVSRSDRTRVEPQRIGIGGNYRIGKWAEHGKTEDQKDKKPTIVQPVCKNLKPDGDYDDYFHETVAANKLANTVNHDPNQPLKPSNLLTLNDPTNGQCSALPPSTLLAGLLATRLLGRAVRGK